MTHVLNNTILATMIEGLTSVDEVKDRLGYLWLRIDHSKVVSFVEEAGYTLPYSTKTIWLKIPETPELVEAVQKRSVYGGEAGFLHKNHYLHLIQNRMYMEYSGIIGSWKIFELDDDTLTRLKASIVEVYKNAGKLVQAA